MKRMFFGGIALALLLTSCGNEGPQGVFEKALVDANLPEETALFYSSAQKENLDLQSALGSGYVLAEDLSLSRGAAVYSAPNGGHMVYSLYTGEAIGTSFDGSYSVYDSDVAGFYLYCEDGETAAVYDGLGNCLYEGTPVLGLTFSEGYRNGQYEVRMSGLDGSMGLVDQTHCYVPSEEGDMVPVLVEWSLAQFPGSTSTAIDLSPYGLEGMSLVNRGDWTCYVVDGIGEIRSFFTLPYYPYASSSSGYFAGGYLVGQCSIPLLEDAEEYSYFREGTKYDLVGYRIDLLSGNVEYFEPEYVISSSSSSGVLRTNEVVNDQGGLPTLVPLSVTLITERKALGALVEVLLDASGNIAYETNGVALNAFVRMGNGSYFNYESRCLYDENLVLLHDLSGLTATYLAGPDAILLQSGTMEALLSPDGTFLLPFAEQSIVAPSEGYPIVYCLGTDTLRSYEVNYGEEGYALGNSVLLKNLADGYSYALSEAGFGLYSLVGLNGEGSLASLDVYFNNECLDSRSGTLSVDITRKAPSLGRGYVRMDIGDGSGEEETLLYRFEA